MQFVVRHPAAEGTVFAAGCLDSQIGKKYAAGVLVAVEYPKDGLSVLLTLETKETSKK